MGQLVTVVEKPSSFPGVVRFETNRSLTGTGHQLYRGADDVTGSTPADELARRFFARGGVDRVHVYMNIITVQLASGASADGLADILEDLYTYYREGVEVVVPEGVAAD